MLDAQLKQKVERLRVVITESLRVQKHGAHKIHYIDSTNALPVIGAAQNHVIFGRRGCGKTLLLQNAERNLPDSAKTIYLNCEDFKNHSFPNVVIHILDRIFKELEKNLSGWFGRKAKLKGIIAKTRADLDKALKAADEVHSKVTTTSTSESETKADVAAAITPNPGTTFTWGGSTGERSSLQLEQEYEDKFNKLNSINLQLPEFKAALQEFFELSSKVKQVFIQVDDFYQLRRTDQPFVIDYIHRLCKDLPLYFKAATLRHASVLYINRKGQPVGAQAGHDYQPITVDYSLSDFARTAKAIRAIFDEFASQAGLTKEELASIFKGEGFERIVLAGGGVPRDCLSLFLEAFDNAQEGDDGRIGKDEVRKLSLANFERRIEELKNDTELEDQDTLMRGAYVLRSFCLQQQVNVFCIPERLFHENERLQDLFSRLMDYRIIHVVSRALSHKSDQGGTYQAYMIDVGCYAHFRKLYGRMKEIDLSNPEAKESLRSAPILTLETFNKFWSGSPKNAEIALRSADDESILPVGNDVKVVAIEKKT